MTESTIFLAVFLALFLGLMYIGYQIVDAFESCKNDKKEVITKEMKKQFNHE